MIDHETSAVPLVTIVTATFNRCGDIVSLLAQVAGLNYPPERIRVIVVDNGSTDDTAERVRQDFPAVQLIENDKNLGTAAGFNLGLKQALGSQPKYVWLLDSDVILESETLAPLVAALEQDPQIGVVGSAVYDPRQRERLVAAGLHIEANSGEVSFVIPDAADENELIDVNLIAACSLMVSSEACRRVGLWDEQLKLYWGDTDWCARFLQAGYRVVCQRKSHVWHRDWTDVDRGFFTPVYLHDHVRGALLYAARHAHNSSVRRLILKSYLRAAVEELTMRRAFASGYKWAIKDFLDASFTQRDFATVVGYSVLPNLSTIADLLELCYSNQEHISVADNCDSQVKADLRDRLEKRFATVAWPDPASDSALSRPRSESLSLTNAMGQLLQLAGGMWKLPWRKDLLVTPLARPRLNNLVTARHTVFLDPQGRGLIYRNRVLAGLWWCFATLVQGCWIGYVKLPLALKRSKRLHAAIHSVDLQSNPSQPESTVPTAESDQIYAAR